MPKLLTADYLKTLFRATNLYDSLWAGNANLTIKAHGDEIWFYLSNQEVTIQVLLNGTTQGTYILPAGFGVIRQTHGDIYLPTREYGWSQIKTGGEVSKIAVYKITATGAPRFKLFKSIQRTDSI